MVHMFTHLPYQYNLHAYLIYIKERERRRDSHNGLTCGVPTEAPAEGAETAENVDGSRISPGRIRVRSRSPTTINATHGEMKDGSEDASRVKELGAWLALVPGHGAAALEVLGCWICLREHGGGHSFMGLCCRAKAMDGALVLAVGGGASGELIRKATGCKPRELCQPRRRSPDCGCCG